jgi:hypothetical protein
MDHFSLVLFKFGLRNLNLNFYMGFIDKKGKKGFIYYCYNTHTFPILHPVIGIH